MDISSPPLGLPGSAEPSDEYLTAVDVLGHVIATRNAAIAALQARSRTDPAVLARLRADHSAAARAVNGLHNHDQQQLRAIVDQYRRLRDI